MKGREEMDRPTVHPPALHQCTAEGARFISPTDPVGGGTWLAANERGIDLLRSDVTPSRHVESEQELEYEPTLPLCCDVVLMCGFVSGNSASGESLSSNNS